MTERLHGSWKLRWAVQSRDGVKRHHRGENPIGQIIYSPDGRMSATIMDPSWLEDGAELNGPEIFMAYAGPWDIESDTVRHHIEICSWPALVGRILVRQFEWRGEDEIFLRSPPSTSRSGAVYQQELLWTRYD